MTFRGRAKPGVGLSLLAVMGGGERGAQSGEMHFLLSENELDPHCVSGGETSQTECG